MDLQNKIDCSVCFFPTSEIVMCNDEKCSFATCFDCFRSYIDFISKEVIPTPPKCINSVCSEWYLDREVRNKVNCELYDDYCNHMLACVCRTNGDVVNDHIAQAHILKRLREKRNAFLRDKFTKPISLVVKIAFQKKLNRINKRRQKMIKNVNNKRKCMSIICSGYLDTKMKCVVCEITFCSKCERIKTESHMCNSEEVASIDALKDIVSCPKCETKIHRSMGCNAMTCAVCSTSFNYQTGQIQKHGSSNATVVLVDRSKITLSGIHKNLKGEILEEVLTFESKKPVKVSENPILNIVKRYKTGELLKNTAARNASRAIEKYKIYTYINRRYIRTASLLELEIIKSTPDLNKVIDIIDMLG